MFCISQWDTTEEVSGSPAGEVNMVAAFSTLGAPGGAQHWEQRSCHTSVTLLSYCLQHQKSSGMKFDRGTHNLEEGLRLEITFCKSLGKLDVSDKNKGETFD